jgi:hypothetical protein
MTLSLPFATEDQTFSFNYLRQGKAGFIAPGVVLSGDMAVSPASGLQVQIAAGEAYIQQSVARLGSFYASRGLYYCFNDGVANPYNSISAPISNPRVDMVIARVYDVYEQQLSGASYWQFQWIQGVETAGANVTYGSSGYLAGVGTLPANSLLLAYVLQTVGESSIASGNVLMDPFMGGWQALTLASGVSADTPGFYIPSWRREGDVVRLKGEMYGTSISTWATLPSGMWPSRSVSPPGDALMINASGILTTPTGVGSLTLDGFTFTLS